MPLPPAIEFLAAQRDSQGNNLCAFGFSYVQTIFTANQRLVWNTAPEEYMSYDFRLLIDDSVVPFAFSGTVYQYGVRPYTGTITPSATEMQIDYFLRVFENQPIVTEVLNLTNLNQRWVSADQYLKVSSEENWKELERRLDEWLHQKVRA